MSNQTIFRVAHRHKPYSQLGNAMLRDKRLSPGATGVLAFILTYPPDWQFNMAWLIEERAIPYNRAYRLIKELQKHGYCWRQRNRREDGTLSGAEYLFTDEPNSPVHQNAQEVQKGTSSPKTCFGEQDATKKVRPKNGIDQNPKIEDRSSKVVSDRKKKPAALYRFVSEDALDRVHTVAPGWDRQLLLRLFTDWPPSKNARNMDEAFIGWATSYTKGQPPGSSVASREFLKRAAKE